MVDRDEEGKCVKCGRYICLVIHPVSKEDLFEMADQGETLRTTIFDDEDFFSEG